MQKKFCFTDQEFSILAGSLGVRSLYGFKPERAVREDEKEVYQCLFRMTGKGFLEASEEGYLVIPEIREIFDCLKAADIVVIISSTDDSFPVKCIYPGGKTVLIEPGGLQGKYFKCSCAPPGHIREDVCDNGVLLPQNVTDDLLYDDAPVTAESLEDMELKDLVDLLENCEKEIDREDLAKYGVHSIIEKRDMHNAVSFGKILLVMRPVYDVIILQNAEKISIFHYSRQLLMDLLDEWMEKGENV